MTHHHLALELLDSFKSNTDKDYYRRTAERNVHTVSINRCLCKDQRCKLREHDREDSDDTQKESSEKCDSRNDPCNVVRCGSAGTNTGDHTAVLGDVLSWN